MKTYILISWNTLFSGRSLKMETFKSEEAMLARKAELESIPCIQTSVEVR
jgi:hypothetical protein